MSDCIRDLSLPNTSQLPNSFLYQPESDCRNWMLKRGKGKMVYYDQGQLRKINDYFKQLDTDNSGKSNSLYFVSLYQFIGMIGASEIEETLISLGLAKTQKDVDTVIKQLDRDANGELDFNEFLEMLKDTSLRNKKGNFLCDRNLLFQKPVEKAKMPDLGSLNAGEEFKEYRFLRDLRNGHDKNLDMKEKDPKI